MCMPLAHAEKLSLLDSALDKVVVPYDCVHYKHKKEEDKKHRYYPPICPRQDPTIAVYNEDDFNIEMQQRLRMYIDPPSILTPDEQQLAASLEGIIKQNAPNMQQQIITAVTGKTYYPYYTCGGDGNSLTIHGVKIDQSTYNGALYLPTIPYK